jgi:hypothetical protein
MQRRLTRPPRISEPGQPGTESQVGSSQFNPSMQRHLTLPPRISEPGQPGTESQVGNSRRTLQCFGCGSGLDGSGPFRSVDPDSESGSGSRRGKMTHENRNFF